MTYLDLGSMKLASLVQQQDQLGLFFPETTAQNIENIKMICSQCNKSISSQFEIFFELDEHFYHRDCYKCKKCSQPFSYIHSTERQTCLPIADHSGILYCDLHFINLLTCCICSKHFGKNSIICKLNAPNQELSSSGLRDYLAHSECTNCQNCQKKIDIFGQYALNTSNERCFINCKNCILKSSRSTLNNSRNKIVYQHRLSSRQKELLATRIIASNIKVEEILDESHAILSCLANEIRCTKKSLIDYIKKHLNKIGDAKNANINTPVAKSNIELMLDELKRLDDTLAPNKFPFGNPRLESSSSNNSLNVLGDLTNSLIQ